MSQKFDLDKFRTGCSARNVRTDETVMLISEYKADDLNDIIWVVEGAEGNLYMEYERNLYEPYEWR